MPGGAKLGSTVSEIEKWTMVRNPEGSSRG